MSNKPIKFKYKLIMILLIVICVVVAFMSIKWNYDFIKDTLLR